jgi:hypothetical protein
MESNVTHEYVLWIAVAAYALHILEEHELNWRDWAQKVLHLPVEWKSFYVVNSLVVVLGVSCAAVGWREPWFGLAFPAVMLINGTFFHVAPTIVTRIFSPGLISAVLLFYPVAGWAYYAAWADGALTVPAGVLSGVLGAALMATPIVLLKVKNRKMFDYAAGDSAEPEAKPDADGK